MDDPRTAFQESLKILGPEELMALCQFREIALCDDRIPSVLDAVYLFGQMPENEKEVLDKGAEMVLSGKAKFVCIPEQFGKGHPAYSEPWCQALIQRGVPISKIIILCADSNEEPNTWTECTVLMYRALTNGWCDVGVIAATFHQPRSLLTMISEVLNKKAPLRVWSIPANSANWGEVITHSSGATTCSRADMIGPENLRMATYDNLVRPSVALRYLQRGRLP
ncbi:MAG: hypothetical protein Q8R36_00555 [bacterium]|nr:hypothetical protein [bacterium]